MSLISVSMGRPISRLTMVTVVDEVNFMKDYEAAISLQEAGESLGEEDQRSVVDLLVDQAEFADVILISKTDLFFRFIFLFLQKKCMS